MLPVPLLDFRRAPVTLILAAVAVALALVCTFDPGRRDFYYMGLRLGIMSPIWAGEIWRPFTTTLLHGDLIHAAFNVYWLVTFAPVLEDRLGSFRTLALIVLLAFVSTLPQFIVTNYDVPIDEQVRILGLSGVVFGLLGILWMGRLRHPEFELVCNRTVVQFFVFWFFLCIALTHARLWPVANVAHGAGLVFGLLYGRALFDKRRRAPWIALAAVASLLVLATLVYCPGHNGYEYHRNRLGARPGDPVIVTTSARPGAEDSPRSRPQPTRPSNTGRQRGALPNHSFAER